MGLALGNAAGAGAMGLPLPGGTPTAGAGQPQMMNPLAQMLAGLGPNYQVPDTRWGLPGDRLLRFTPQQGNAGMAAGGLLGKGGTPPPTGAGSGIRPINWGQIGAQLDANGNPVPIPPPAAPPGAPAINAAMQNVGTQPLSGRTPITPLDYSGPRPSTESLISRENAARAYARQVLNERPPRGATQAAQDAWFSKYSAANRDYIQASKDTGLSGGADPWAAQTSYGG